MIFKSRTSFLLGLFFCFVVAAGVLFFLLRPGIVITELQPGVGQVAKNGFEVTVQYEAFVKDPSKPQGHGALFDSTYQRQAPAKFILGQKQTIVGLEQGLIGMRVGQQRVITIPARLAYGSVGAAGGLVPPNADVIYKVEMKKVSEVVSE